jgi:hypothetical protein
MTHSVEGNVAEVLSQGDAHVHERWVDDFDNVWEVREDREGLRLDAVGGNATIPYWTTYVVRLPGLHRL